MKPTLTKAYKALSLLLVIWQIPMLLLWKLTYDVINLESQQLEVETSGKYELVFVPDRLWEALLRNAWIVVALLACLILSVVGMIAVLRQKPMGKTGIWLYALVALGGLVVALAFSQPASPENHSFILPEFMFYRYFAGMELDARVITAIFPYLQLIKYAILGVQTAVSGVLCGLSVVELMKDRAQTKIEAT